MKKYIVFLLVATLLFSLCACDISPDSKDKEKTSSSTSSKDKDSLIDNIVDDIPNDNSDIFHSTDEFPPFNQSGSIDETVIYDEKDLRITVTSLKYESSFVELAFVFENNSKKNYTFAIENCAINNMMFHAYANAEIAANKKGKDTVKFYYDELQLYGINEIAEFLIVFDFYDDNYDHFYTDPIQIKTSLADTFVYDENAYQTAITSEAAANKNDFSVLKFIPDSTYSNKNVRVLSQCLLRNIGDELTLLLEVRNNNSNKICFNVENISINNLTVYGRTNWTSAMILPNTSAIVSVNLSSLIDIDYFTAYGIDNISVISVSVSLKDETYKEIFAATPILIPVDKTESAFDTSGTVLYESKNIRLIFKDIVNGEGYYNDDIYILLLAENKKDIVIDLAEEYNSFSINGYMADCSFYGTDIPAGAYSIVAIKLFSYMVEDADISSVEEIEEFEISFEIRNTNYMELEDFTVSYSVS